MIINYAQFTEYTFLMSKRGCQKTTPATDVCDRGGFLVFRCFVTPSFASY